jgi:hypothetical protein
MSTKTNVLLAIAFAVATTTAPAFAQVAADKDQSAHHYQGGPQTAVPHSMKHPKSESETTTGTATSGGRHYSGGPKIESHHMGEKQ